MSKKKILLFSSLFFVVNLVAFFCFFPTLHIYGYEHQILTSTDPELYVTITENTMFNVLKNDYYSSTLKSAYIISFVLQIISVISSMIMLLLFVFPKKIYHCFFLVPSIVWSVFLIVLFKDSVALLIVAILFFIISLTYFVYLFMKENRKKKEVKSI